MKIKLPKTILFAVLCFIFGIVVKSGDIVALSFLLFIFFLICSFLKLLIAIFRNLRTSGSSEVLSKENIQSADFRISKLSIAGLILSLILIPTPNLIWIASFCGVIALVRISRNKKVLLGKGIAVLAIVISLIVFMVFAEFHSEYEKRMASQIAAAIDSSNPVTRDFAIKFAKKYPGGFNLDQVISIYKYVRNNWKYVDDPRGNEYFSPASRTIKLGLAGDCDDFAIVMAATLKAIGAETRIVLAYGRPNGHAYAEVNVGSNIDKAIRKIKSRYSFFFIPYVGDIYYRSSFGEHWINLDWFANHPGGEYFPSKNGLYVYPDGILRRIRWD